MEQNPIKTSTILWLSLILNILLLNFKSDNRLFYDRLGGYAIQTGEFIGNLLAMIVWGYFIIFIVLIGPALLFKKQRNIGRERIALLSTIFIFSILSSAGAYFNHKNDTCIPTDLYGCE